MEGAHVTNTPLVSRVLDSRCLTRLIYFERWSGFCLGPWTPERSQWASERVQWLHMCPRVCLLSNQAKRTPLVPAGAIAARLHGFVIVYHRPIHSFPFAFSACFILFHCQERPSILSAPPYTFKTSSARGQKIGEQKIYTKRESNPPRVLDSVGN